MKKIKKMRWVMFIVIVVFIGLGLYQQYGGQVYEKQEIQILKTSDDIEAIMSRAEFKRYMENQAKQIHLDEEIVKQKNVIKDLESQLELLRKEEMDIGSLKSATEQSE